MAATIAECIGTDTTRTKTAHKLGSRSATARANTYHTFATAHVNADGSGYIQVERNAIRIHIEFNAETGAGVSGVGQAPLTVTYNTLAPEPWAPTPTPTPTLAEESELTNAAS